MVLMLMDQVYVAEKPYADKEALEVRRLRHQIQEVLDKGYYNATLTDVDVRQLVGR
jgi:hypothetical protein